MTVEVTFRGLDDVRKMVAGIPETVDRASAFAINEAARYGQAESSRRIREQVAFSARYVGSAEDPNSRLRVSKRAKPGDLEAVIAGRTRPTSLAQFVQGSFKRNRPVRVKVSATKGAQMIPNAFPMKLRRGTGVYNPENANVGLAIRLGKDEAVRNKRQMVQVSGSLYLLYGPSVDQVFRDVRFDVQAPVGDVLESSFLRNFARFNRG
ncbi:MAG: hypothetical protein ACREO4_09455 [Lysobacter sp.]